MQKLHHQDFVLVETRSRQTLPAGWRAHNAGHSKSIDRLDLELAQGLRYKIHDQDQPRKLVWQAPYHNDD